jgi:DNA-binding transcriptional ArsR family regulator
MLKDLDENALREVAAYFAALAAPARLKILNALRSGERNVSELTAAAQSTQANVSKHLAALAQNGLVAKTPRGTSVYYRIADPRIYQLCDLVCGQVGRRLEAQSYLTPMLAPAKARRPRAAERSRVRR